MSSFVEGLTSPEVEIAEGGAIVDNKAYAFQLAFSLIIFREFCFIFLQNNIRNVLILYFVNIRFRRFADLKAMLDSSKDSLKMDAMKRIINVSIFHGGN